MQSSQATDQTHQEALEDSTAPPRTTVDPNTLDLAHRNPLTRRANTTDYFADAPTLETQQAHTQNEIGNNGTSHEMLCIISFVAAFISSHGRVSGNVPSQFPVLVHFVISECCLYFLVEVLGSHYVSLAGIAPAMAVSLFDTYRGVNTYAFTPYAIIIGIVAIAFFWTALFKVQLAQSANGSKLFAVTSLVLKQLLENDVVPMDTYPSSNVLYDVQNVLFAASFLLSIMALWLQASGIAPLNPLHRGPVSVSSIICPSILAFDLFWTGSALTAAYVIVTIVLSSATTPTIATIACVSFTMCTAAVLIKQVMAIRSILDAGRFHLRGHVSVIIEPPVFLKFFVA